MNTVDLAGVTKTLQTQGTKVRVTAPYQNGDVGGWLGVDGYLFGSALDRCIFLVRPTESLAPYAVFSTEDAERIVIDPSGSGVTIVLRGFLLKGGLHNNGETRRVGLPTFS